MRKGEEQTGKPDDDGSVLREVGPLKDGASLGDLTKMIDQGVPPMVLMDPDGGANTVTGYTRNADGSVKDLLISDTWGATGAAQGRRYTMSAGEFDAK